jgi:hypothetical protein
MYKRVIGTYSPETCPDKSISAFVTSWGRSGNTYSAEIVKRLYADLRVGSHAHSIASLKCANRSCVPILLIFREPLQTIASFVVKQRHLLATSNDYAVYSSVRDYCEYHSYALKLCGRAVYIPFKDVIDEPQILVDAMESFGFLRPSAAELIAVHDDVMAFLRSDSRSPEKRQLGSPEKDDSKSKLFDLIRRDRNWSRALSVFSQLESQALVRK